MNGKHSVFPHKAGYGIVNGITNREYAAIHILQGLAANSSMDIFDCKGFAKLSVRLADALIDELNK